MCHCSSSWLPWQLGLLLQPPTAPAAPAALPLCRADVNAADNFLWTPLHHACYNGHLDIAEVLVKAGAAVNAPSIGEATPLMRAVEACRLDMVYFLITAGADVQAVDSNGKWQCLQNRLCLY